MDPQLERVLQGVFPTVEGDFRIRRNSLFSKMFVLHLASSLLTLSVCQQFGIRFLGNFDLMHYFMFGGPLLCQVFCGAFYLGTTSFFVSKILPRHELAWVRRRAFPIGSFAAISSLILLLVMGEPMAPLYLVAWFVGALFAGLIVLLTTRAIRFGHLSFNK